MEYKAENFIVDVVVEKGKKLFSREDIIEFLFEEGYLTHNGSGFEIDLLEDVMDELDWERILKCIDDNSDWETESIMTE
jgi:hypothetical protein